MITSRLSTQSSTWEAKSLDCRQVPEAKTPEIETVLESTGVNVNKLQSRGAESKDEEQETFQPFELSTRAQAIKASLQRADTINAVVLKADGSADQISFAPTSSQINVVLGGRPTIIGEIEALNAVIIRSLDSADSVNAHVLPAPFCNKQHRGNYLLFRVGEKGAPSGLSLDAYRSYATARAKDTEKARKNYNAAENQEIHGKSSFSNNSDISLIALRSEFDAQIRAECKGQDLSEADIAMRVNASVQNAVDKLTDVDASSKMSDPDYDPLVDEIEVAPKQDSTDWRLQLKEALTCVRARARFDGQLLAEKISETFYELNGTEPSLDELSGVFARVQQDLAAEALEDLAEADTEKTAAPDNGSALCLADSINADLKSADPTEVVDIAFRVVREDFIARAKSSFRICRGREPSNEELTESVRKLALSLADDAIAGYNGTFDADYDPNNASDKVLEQRDENEDDAWDARNFNFNMQMLQTPERASQSGNTSYDVFFDRPNAKRHEKNVRAAKNSFRMRNGRDPTPLELNALKQFISVDQALSVVKFELSVVDADEKESMAEREQSQVVRTKVLVTPVKAKKSAARYDVFFEDGKSSEQRNERMAIRWFNRFNNRQPTEKEVAAIKQFVDCDAKLTEVQCEVQLNDADDDAKETEEEFRIRSRARFVVNKKDSTKYTLNFDDSAERENGDETEAIQWFKRFNNREPSSSEIDNIRQFIKADNDTIDID